MQRVGRGRNIPCVLRFVFSLLAATLVVGAAAPAANPPLPLIPAGVTVAGISVGGMTAVPARAAIERTFERPLRFGFYRKRWKATPHQLGAAADVDGAVMKALQARPNQKLRLDVTIDRERVRGYVHYLHRLFSRPMKDAELVGLQGLRPLITPEQPGRELERPVIAAKITRALRWTFREPIPLRLKPVEPEVTVAGFGPVVVIRRGSNQLDLYDGMTPVRSFRVATGKPAYPTPLGHWSIVDMQRDPWWRPPPSDWAKDLKPVPPGPGNPLGTRWMGISSPAVGIHGTPDAGSIGYSVSHGCIRMHIPDAEWLFTQVRVGTPVFIVSA